MVALDVMHELLQELLSKFTPAPITESPLKALSSYRGGYVMGRWGRLYGFPFACVMGNNGVRKHHGDPCDCTVISQRFQELPFAEQDFWVRRLNK